MRLLDDGENPYRKPIRDGVVWNEEVIKAFTDGARAQCELDLKEFVETLTKVYNEDEIRLALAYMLNGLKVEE